MGVNKKTARTAGILYLIIILGSILGGMISEMYIQSRLVANAAGQADTMIIPEWVYGVGFNIYLLVYLSDLATALVLYVLLKPVNSNLALLAASFRFAEAGILGFNLVNQHNAFLFLSSAEYAGLFQPEQLQAFATMYLNSYRSGYLVSQVFFGVHCFFLGVLLFKSGYFPKVMGGFLVAASFGYLTESFLYFLLPNFEAVESVMTVIVALPAFLAEISITYWLLFKGSAIEKQYTQLASPA